jgi:cell division protein FtsB
MWDTLKAIIYIAVALFSAYAIFVSDNKSLSYLAIAAWIVIYGRWLLLEYEARKAKEKDRFDHLQSRVAYLERQMRELDRD